MNILVMMTTRIIEFVILLLKIKDKLAANEKEEEEERKRKQEEQEMPLYQSSWLANLPLEQSFYLIDSVNKDNGNNKKEEQQEQQEVFPTKKTHIGKKRNSPKIY